MPKAKLTKRTIDAAKPAASEYMLWDTEVRGLGLKVRPSGRKMFMLFYRTADGTQRKPKVGAYGQITLAQAREIALDMLNDVRAGKDPSGARRNARQAPTVEEACDRFVREHAKLKKPLTCAQYEGLIDRYVKPALGSRKVASIRHDDVARVVHSVGKTHPIAANRLRAMLSKLFNLCEKWGWRPTGSNPCAHIERYSEQKRHRDLSELELARLAKVLIAAETPPDPYAKGPDGEPAQDRSENPRAVGAIRLLLFTGCRRNEVLRLKWSEVDLERGLLRIGDSKTGAKIVPLNQAAREVLEAQPRMVGNPYVFPSARKPGKPLHDVKRVWDRIRTRAKLEDMRLHDLRHHFASTAAASGLSLPLIGRLLGHRTPTTTARYAELADDPARRASEAVGEALSTAMEADAKAKKSEGRIASAARDPGGRVE